MSSALTAKPQPKVEKAKEEPKKMKTEEMLSASNILSSLRAETQENQKGDGGSATEQAKASAATDAPTEKDVDKMEVDVETNAATATADPSVASTSTHVTQTLNSNELDEFEEEAGNIHIVS